MIALHAVMHFAFSVLNNQLIQRSAAHTLRHKHRACACAHPPAPATVAKIL